MEISNKESLRTVAKLWEQLGDGKCWLPCKNCKGMKIRILRSTTIKHCWEYGHLKGGHEFHPMVISTRLISLLHV